MSKKKENKGGVNPPVTETKEIKVESKALVTETKEVKVESKAPVIETTTTNVNEPLTVKTPSKVSETKTNSDKKPIVKEVEDDNVLDANGTILKNAINQYLTAVTSLPEKQSQPVKENMLKTVKVIFDRNDLTQASADILNNAFKREVYCGELALLRGLRPTLHPMVSYIHAKLSGKEITIAAPIGNAEKIK